MSGKAGDGRHETAGMKREDVTTAAPQDSASRNQVQVIARAAAIMRALEDAPRGLSLGQIATRTGLARSTVQRIVAALAHEKLLIAASPEGRVRLGPALLRLAAAVDSDFVATARPFLVALSQDLQETVDLAAVRGDYLVFIDQVVGSQRLRTVSAVGESFPLYCTANGKACLAEMTNADVKELVRGGLAARTPSTITDMGRLLAELDEIRLSGVAFDREEHSEGIAAAGVALRDALGNLVAVSVPVPAARFASNEAQISESLLRMRDLMRARLAE